MNLAEAVERGDPDELLREIDQLCAGKAWDQLVELRLRCREAVHRGKQLWGVAEHIRYRLALEAPGAWAGPAVAEGPGRFTLGPLPEVAASRHTWEELKAHLPPGTERTLTAHERVVRGEDLRTVPDLDPMVLEVPLGMQPWEPAYAVAEYDADRADFHAPPSPRLEEVRLPTHDGTAALAVPALYQLVAPWAEESNGRVETAAVDGDALASIGAFGLSSAWIGGLDPGTAMAQMAWAAASGGAHGRRRGAASGRFGAWWAVAELAGLDWPPPPDALGDALYRLQWWGWSPPGGLTGWTLHLAVEDPTTGRSFAIGAVDAV